MTMAGNICSDEDCAAAVAKCVEAYSALMNVVSHNAGISDDFTLVEDIRNEDWDRLLAVNLTGSMKVARAALQYLVPNEIEASIVMITSNAAFESATGGPAYCASKAGANALMKSIAFEYKRVGIRCNSICPGPILTNITDSAPVFNKKGSVIHQTSGYNADAYKWTGGEIGFPDEDIAPSGRLSGFRRVKVHELQLLRHRQRRLPLQIKTGKRAATRAILKRNQSRRIQQQSLGIPAVSGGLPLIIGLL